jgi:hypothetical protein
VYQLLPALARGGPGHPSMASLATAALVGLFAAATAWSAEPAAQEASPPAEAPAAEAPPPESPAAEASPAGGAESVDSLQLALTLQAVGRLEACAVEALRHAYRSIWLRAVSCRRGSGLKAVSSCGTRCIGP